MGNGRGTVTGIMTGTGAAGAFTGEDAGAGRGTAGAFTGAGADTGVGSGADGAFTGFTKGVGEQGPEQLIKEPLQELSLAFYLEKHLAIEIF